MKLAEDDTPHVAKQSDYYDMTLAEAGFSFGAYMDRIAGEKPNIDSILANGATWTDSAYGRSQSMEGVDNS